MRCLACLKGQRLRQDFLDCARYRFTSESCLGGFWRLILGSVSRAKAEKNVVGERAEEGGWGKTDGGGSWQVWCAFYGEGTSKFLRYFWVSLIVALLLESARE